MDYGMGPIGRPPGVYVSLYLRNVEASNRFPPPRPTVPIYPPPDVVPIVPVEVPSTEWPVAYSQSITTDEDTPVTVTLVGTDAETSPSMLQFTLVDTPVHGGLSGTAPNLIYTPVANYHGTDLFHFYVTDEESRQSNVALVLITVRAVNDRPVAYSQFVNTQRDLPVAITLTGSDLETPSHALLFDITSWPLQGAITGSPPNITYTPEEGYSGNDTLKFTVTDTGDEDSPPLTSLEATVSILVDAVNFRPVANPQLVSTPENTSRLITLTGVDSETASQDLVYAVQTPPAHGSLSGTAPSMSYTPNPAYYGSDSFTFVVTDGDGLPSYPAVIAITVTPVNVRPVASPQSITLDQDTSTSVVLSGSDTETATQNLVYTVTAIPSHGSLTGTAPNLTYIPTAGYYGPDSFKFTVRDTGKSTALPLTSLEATVSITVSAVNTAPTASPQSVTVTQGEFIEIVLSGSDAETPSQDLIFNVVTGPASGVITGTAPNLTYTPSSEFTGSDSITFTVTDTGKGSAPPLTSAEATISITVEAASIPILDETVYGDWYIHPDYNSGFAIQMGMEESPNDILTAEQVAFWRILTENQWDAVAWPEGTERAGPVWFPYNFANNFWPFYEKFATGDPSAPQEGDFELQSMTGGWFLVYVYRTPV